VLAAAAAFAGDSDLEAEASAAWVTTGRMPKSAGMLLAAMAGDHTEFSAARASVASDLFRAGSAVLAAELGDWTGDGALAAAQREALMGLTEAGIVNVPGWPVSVLRAASLSALWDGDHKSFAELNATEISRANAAGARVSLALARYDAARHGLAGTGIGTLAATITEFESLGMRSWIARAQPDFDAHPDAKRLAESYPTRVMLYTDLVGSTAVNVRAGDRRFVELLAEHQAIIDESIAMHRGTRFHSTGDGFGIWFLGASEAIACAVDIHRRMERASESHPDLPLQVRIGLAAGQPIPFDGDLYGVAVVRAARVCAKASAGEVYLSSEVLDSERLADVEVDDAEHGILKGFDVPTTLYRLKRKDHPNARKHALSP
jgi:class 3 adenylate cyclase